MLDASALSLSACTYKLWMTTVEGYKPKLSTINIEVGTAFHKFRNIIREEGPSAFPKACVEAKQHLATAEYAPTTKYNAYLADPVYLMRVCSEYMIKYEHDNLQPLHLEMRFCFPFYVDDYVEVLIAGTIDEIGKLDSGIFVLCDCKTTSAANAKDKLASYLLSNQLMFYYWVLKLYGQQFPDTSIGEVCAGDIAIMIDGVFFRGKEKVEFERSEYWLPPRWITDEYARVITQKITNLCTEFSRHIKAGTVPAKDGLVHNVCTLFNKCDYFYHCSAVDEFVADVMLKRHLVQKHYNPLNHQT